MYLECLLHELGRFGRDDSFIKGQLSQFFGVDVSYGLGISSVYSNKKGLDYLSDYKHMIYALNYKNTNILFLSCASSDDLMSKKGIDYFGISSESLQYLLDDGCVVIFMDARDGFIVRYKSLHSSLLVKSDINMDLNLLTIIDFMLDNYDNALDIAGSRLSRHNVDLNRSIFLGDIVLDSSVYKIVGLDCLTDLENSTKELRDSLKSNKDLLYKSLGFLFSGGSFIDKNNHITFESLEIYNDSYFPNDSDVTVLSAVQSSFSQSPLVNLMVHGDLDTHYSDFCYNSFKNYGIGSKVATAVEFPKLIWGSFFDASYDADNNENLVSQFCEKSNGYVSTTKSFRKSYKFCNGLYADGNLTIKRALNKALVACKDLGLNPYEFTCTNPLSRTIKVD